MGPDKRRNIQLGIIEEFLAEPDQPQKPIYLYNREIRRIQNQFPQIEIKKESQLRDSKLWKCTISKR